MGNNQNKCEEIGIKPANEIGSFELDALWIKYAGDAQVLKTSTALKFIKDFCAAVGVEYNSKQVQTLLKNNVSGGYLEFEQFKNFFLEFVKNTHNPQSPVPTNRVLLTQSLAVGQWVPQNFAQQQIEKANNNNNNNKPKLKKNNREKPLKRVNSKVRLVDNIIKEEEKTRTRVDSGNGKEGMKVERHSSAVPRKVHYNCKGKGKGKGRAMNSPRIRRKAKQKSMPVQGSGLVHKGKKQKANKERMVSVAAKAQMHENAEPRIIPELQETKEIKEIKEIKKKQEIKAIKEIQEIKEIAKENVEARQVRPVPAEANEESVDKELMKFLVTLRMQKYYEVFEQNEIGFKDLPYLTEQEFKEMNIPLGPRKRALALAKSLWRK